MVILTPKQISSSAQFGIANNLSSYYRRIESAAVLAAQGLDRGEFTIELNPDKQPDEIKLVLKVVESDKRESSKEKTMQTVFYLLKK